MQYVERILQNERFRREMESLGRAEEKRIYCRHDMEHLLAVARIAALLSEDEGLHIRRGLIYAAALLHDIGRGMEYREGVPHEEASVMLAKDILRAVGYPEADMQEVLAAIASHRGSNQEKQKTDTPLAKLLRRADRLSRNCFCCRAGASCNWDAGRRNRTVVI